MHLVRQIFRQQYWLSGVILLLLNFPSPSLGTDIEPELIKQSPVLQRWLKEIPDVGYDIQNNPAFRTRWRVNYTSGDRGNGISLGVEDARIDRSRITLSGQYTQQFNPDRASYGLDAQYYLLPLGSYVNIAPIIGYRHLAANEFNRGGLNMGVKLLLVGGRGGGADVSISQSWVSLGSKEETGLTSINGGYALTNNIRIGVDINQRNAPENQERRYGIGLEWMP